MPSRTLQKLKPTRSLRRLQTVFSPSDSSNDSSSPHSTPTSATTGAIDFRGLDKSLNASVTNLILTSLDENGSWAKSENAALSLSSSHSSSTRSNSYTPAPVVSPEPRGLMKMIRRKKSKNELQQAEERQQVRGDLLTMIEPRPSADASGERIEEVLRGNA